MNRLAKANPLVVNIGPNVNLSPTAMRGVLTGEMPAHGTWMLQHLLQCGTTLPGPVTMLAPGEVFPKKRKGTFIRAIPNEPDDSQVPETSVEGVSTLPTPSLGHESGGQTRKQALERAHCKFLNASRPPVVDPIAKGQFDRAIKRQMLLGAQ
jgi:hypothetical protein